MRDTAALGSEKRRAERISTERPVQIDFDDPASPKETMQGTMLNLSTLGAGFVSPTPVPEGAVVTLNFQLPTAGAHPIQAKAQSRHSVKVRQQFLTGVEFIHLSAFKQNQIQTFITRHHTVDHL